MLTPLHRRLLRAAAAARRRAYAPYSRFTVGAALLTADGEVVTGCNVENASYGLTLCAERAAVCAAVAAGRRRFKALAVVGGGATPPMPCGACRQVLAEFCRPDLLVLAAAPNALAHPIAVTLNELLPRAFSLKRRS